MVSFASNHGDLCGAMRKWEPTCLKEIRNSWNDEILEAWAKLERKAPIKIPKGSPLKSGKIGLFLGVLAVGGLTYQALKGEFNAQA